MSVNRLETSCIVYRGKLLPVNKRAVTGETTQVTNVTFERVRHTRQARWRTSRCDAIERRVDVGEPFEARRGRELAGYEVANLAGTLAKATGAGIRIVVAPFETDQWQADMVQFPGGFIAYIHAALKK